MEVTKEVIKIEPKTDYLSSAELTRQRNEDCAEPGMGLKKTMPDGSEEEKLELEKLYEQLKKQLSLPRIERVAGRAVAEWDTMAQAARVTRKDGKFEMFGYNVDGKYFLEYYEALFLMEVNRLQLEYDSRVLSIEQAYLLLMGEEKSKKYSEYLVYSHLTRVGYILVRHQNKHFQKHQIDNAEDCVWAILDAKLEGDEIPDCVRKSEYYAKTQKQFDDIRNSIVNQKPTNDNEDENTDHILLKEEKTISLNFDQKIKPCRKRKAEDIENLWCKAKRHRPYTTYLQQQSLVDFLKDEDEYKNFKTQFDKFDIIPLKTYEETDEDMEHIEELTLTINFDVYLHNDGFRKSSPQIPHFRVIILDAADRFPTHKEMFFTHRKQMNAVPLVLVTVNDSKQIQAFLYYFS